MNYTNSSLATYTLLSPNSTNPRNHEIDTITIHHIAGVCSAETIANIFQPTERQASCNYGIGNDGKIALIVEENNRSWCTSSRENDHRAITFEVSNCQRDGDWPVSDAALEATINLCVDICKRYGKSKMVWNSDKNYVLANDPKPGEMRMTIHKWLAATACPGPYLESKMPYIAEEVSKRLGSNTTPVTPVDNTLHKGSYGDTVKQLQQHLIELGYDLSKYGADSDFGSETEAAVIQFQKDNGLTANGKVDTATEAAIEARLIEKRTQKTEPPAVDETVEPEDKQDDKKESDEQDTTNVPDNTDETSNNKTNTLIKIIKVIADALIKILKKLIG